MTLCAYMHMQVVTHSFHMTLSAVASQGCWEKADKGSTVGGLWKTGCLPPTVTKQENGRIDAVLLKTGVCVLMYPAGMEIIGVSHPQNFWTWPVGVKSHGIFPHGSIITMQQCDIYVHKSLSLWLYVHFNAAYVNMCIDWLLCTDLTNNLLVSSSVCGGWFLWAHLRGCSRAP